MRRGAFAPRRFKPAYVKQKDPVDPGRVLKRVAGEAFTGVLTPQQREDLIVADYLQEHRTRIDRRKEWMAAEAIINGQVTVVGEDYPAVTISFGRDAAMAKNLTGAQRWSEATSNPLEDIETWQQEMHRKCGYTPTRITMGINAWNAFKKHPAIKEYLETRRGGTTVIETGPGKGLPWQYRTTLDSAGLEVWTYNDIYEDASGNQVNFLNQDTIVFTSPAIDGVRAHGAIMDRRAGYVATELFSKMWEQEDPSALFIMSQTAPLMIPTRPNASMRVKVLNAA